MNQDGQKHNLYQHAMNFAKNYLRNNPCHKGLSNIYVFRLTDRDGNVVDEKYGMNLMTDLGMTQYFTTDALWSSVNFYVGSGTNATIDYSTSSLLIPYEPAATLVSSVVDYAYPMYYLEPVADTPGIITTICRARQYEYDFNVSGFGSVTTISEYGLGTSYDALWTHAWVYDSNGNQATITKRSNMELTIDVFFCMSYTDEMINNLWDSGKFTMITTMQRFFNKPAISGRNVAMAEANLCTFRRYSGKSARTKSAHSVSVEDGVATIVSNMENFTLIQSSDSNQDYIDGFASMHTGMSMFEWVEFGSTISFDTVTYPNPTYMSEIDCFSYNFGATGYLRFSHCNVTGSRTYNFRTGEYDEIEASSTFVQTPNKRYTEFGLSLEAATPIYFWNNDSIMSMYLYCNMNTSDPILKIKGDLLWVYATDEYWNFDAWHLITDIKNIPQAYQNSKYWITNSNSIALDPVRASQSFMYKDSQTAEKFNFETSMIKTERDFSTSNYDGRWFVIGNKLYDTNVLRMATVGVTTGHDQTYSTGYGRYVITINNSQPFIYKTDMTGQQIIQTVYESPSISDMMNTHKSENGRGLFIFSEVPDSTTWLTSKHVIVKIDGNGITITPNSDSLHDMACIGNSDYYAYLSGRNLTVVNSTNQQSTTIAIPSSASDSSSRDPIFIFGFGNYVYASNGPDVWLCDMSVASPAAVKCGGDFTNMMLLAGSDRALVRSTATNDCLILYRKDSGTLQYACAILSTDPTDIIALTSSSRTTGSTSTIEMNVTTGSNITIYEISMKLWQPSANTLILHTETYELTNGSNWYSEVGYDIGKILRDKTITTNDWHHKREYDKIKWIPYGTHLIRLTQTFSSKNLISHKLSGTTTCVTTYDWPKHINGKSWTLQVTNRSNWRGKPPGTPAGQSTGGV